MRTAAVSLLSFWIFACAEEFAVPQVLEKAEALRKSGEWKAAVQLYERALEKNPHPEFAHNLGNLYLDLNRLPAAEQSYRAALRLQPNFAPAHNGLALALARQGRYRAAVESLDRALEIDPDFEPARENRKRLAAFAALESLR